MLVPATKALAHPSSRSVQAGQVRVRLGAGGPPRLDSAIPSSGHKSALTLIAMAKACALGAC